MDDLKRAFFQRGGPRRELERATISSSTSMPAEVGDPLPAGSA